MEHTFGKNIIPYNDAERLAALKRYAILDTPPEAAFDRIAKLATTIFKTPVSLISLVDTERVFFKANIGAGEERESPRSDSLCALAVLSPEVLVFENAPEDPCLLANPNVAAEHGLKFYAGAPLITPDNFQIGTLCVIDFSERKFTEEQRVILKELAAMVMHEIELRAAAAGRVAELTQSQQDLETLNDQLEERVLEHTQAADDSKYRLEAMVMNTPIAMAILKGQELVVEVANQPMLDVWRRELSQVLGRSLMEIFPELEGQPNPERMRRVLQTGQRFALPETEVVLGTVDGVLKKHYARFSYDPIFEADGTVGSLLVTVINITDEVLNRQQLLENSAEMAAMNEELTTANEKLSASREELQRLVAELAANNEEQRSINLELANLNEKYRRSQDELQLAIDAAALGTFDLDPATGKFSGNDLLKFWFGLSPEDKIELRKATDVIADSDRDRVMSAIAHSLTYESGGDYAVQYTIINPLDPVPRIVRAIGKTMFNERQEPMRLSGVLQDVTEQTRDEQRKNDFIGMVSHELKTPLTSLNAIVQVLNTKLRTSDDAFVTGALDRAHIQVRKMSAMINGFLNISRLESGKIQLLKKEFNLAELIQSIISETKLIANSHEITLSAFEQVPVFADEDKVGSVISNLLSNAVKYSPKGTPIRLACRTEAGQVEVSVHDQGIGVKPEDQPHLFDRYYRVDNPNYSHISGFGIGLYLSAEIIHQHGGRIWVESEPGQGSAFYFNLPLNEK